MAEKSSQNVTPPTETYAAVVDGGKSQNQVQQCAPNEINVQKTKEEMLLELKKWKNKVGIYQKNNANLKRKLNEVEEENQELTVQLKANKAVVMHLTQVICKLRSNCK